MVPSRESIKDDASRKKHSVENSGFTRSRFVLKIDASMCSLVP